MLSALGCPAQNARTGVMIGHQDDPVYGRAWAWDEGRSDVKDICGDYPAVMGFDLGGIELGAAENLDRVPFDRIRREVQAQHRRGGLVTLSWHPHNPVNDSTSWDTTPGSVANVLPGGRCHRQFRRWLGLARDYIRSLKDDNGRQIPVVFRPWHEMNGGWFWWGSKSATPAEYIALYQMTWRELHSIRGLRWGWSPNRDDTRTDHYSAYYPGDRYVDIVGADVYDFGEGSEAYSRNVRRELAIAEAFARDHGKLLALTETGQQQIPDTCFFTGTLLPILKSFPLYYVLLWRNAWDNQKEYYIAAPGMPQEADFRRFHADRHTLFANDLKP